MTSKTWDQILAETHLTSVGPKRYEVKMPDDAIELADGLTFHCSTDGTVTAQRGANIVKPSIKLSIEKHLRLSIPEIENTVFNGDTTIIIWKDKTKTIVHCEPDKPRDPYAAFCAAVCKKLFGSTDKVMKVIADTDKAYQAKLRAEAAAKKKAENIAKQEELKAKAETRRKEADEAIREAFYINEKLRREAKKRLAEEEEKGGEA